MLAVGGGCVECTVHVWSRAEAEVVWVEALIGMGCQCQRDRDQRLAPRCRAGPRCPPAVCPLHQLCCLPLLPVGREENRRRKRTIQPSPDWQIPSSVSFSDAQSILANPPNNMAQPLVCVSNHGAPGAATTRLNLRQGGQPTKMVYLRIMQIDGGRSTLASCIRDGFPFSIQMENDGDASCQRWWWGASPFLLSAKHEQRKKRERPPRRVVGVFVTRVTRRGRDREGSFL
jgi:hypothetical protein